MANTPKKMQDPTEAALSAIQRELLRQGAYLSPAIAAAVRTPAAAE